MEALVFYAKLATNVYHETAVSPVNRCHACREKKNDVPETRSELRTSNFLAIGDQMISNRG